MDTGTERFALSDYDDDPPEEYDDVDARRFGAGSASNDAPPRAHRNAHPTPKKPSAMTAKAVARDLGVDLATVTRLVRHEIRDVPLQPEDAPLRVVYEDECVMAVAKPAGTMTYPAHRLRGGSVVSRAVHHLNVQVAASRGRRAERSNGLDFDFHLDDDLEDDRDVPDVFGAVTSGIEPIAVHRLDLETSGVLLLAKDKHSASTLQSEFETRGVRKTYLAVCAVLAEDAVEKDAEIERKREEAIPGEVRVVRAAIGDAEPGTSSGNSSDGGRCIRAVTPEGKPATTEYQAISTRAARRTRASPPAGLAGSARNPDVSRAPRTIVGAALVLARPLTGRTHQVRLHLAHAGLPIVGDALYGVSAEDVADAIAARGEGSEGADGDEDGAEGADSSRASREAAARRRVLTRPGRPGSGGSGADAVAPARAFGAAGRMALHAWNLSATHPARGTPMRFAVDMPEDMSALARALGLSVESVTLGSAASAAATAGGGGDGKATRRRRAVGGRRTVRRGEEEKNRREAA